MDDLITTKDNQRRSDIDQNYQDILVNQLKDKNDEIKELETTIKTLTDDIGKIDKKYNSLKSKVSALIK